MIKVGSLVFNEGAVRQLAHARKVLEKQSAVAAPWTVPSNVGGWLAAGLGLGAAGAVAALGAQGVNAVAGKIHDTAHAATLNKDFAAMLKADPTLAATPEEKAKAKTYFAILHRASPYLSGEPMLAAPTVRGMMDYENAPGDQKLKSILEVEERYQSTRHPFLTPSLRPLASEVRGIGTDPTG